MVVRSKTTKTMFLPREQVPKGSFTINVRRTFRFLVIFTPPSLERKCPLEIATKMEVSDRFLKISRPTLHPRKKVRSVSDAFCWDHVIHRNPSLMFCSTCSWCRHAIDVGFRVVVSVSIMRYMMNSWLVEQQCSERVAPCVCLRFTRTRNRLTTNSKS